MSESKTTQLESELRQFSGDLDRYRHGFNRRVIYTPGVQYLAEAAEAYWLIDAIASHIGSKPFNAACKEDPRVGEMHFWCLEVAEDRSAVLSACVDSGVQPFLTQNIPFTDFPLAKIDIWAAFDGTYWTLYIPSEH